MSISASVAKIEQLRIKNCSLFCCCCKRQVLMGNNSNDLTYLFIFLHVSKMQNCNIFFLFFRFNFSKTTKNSLNIIIKIKTEEKIEGIGTELERAIFYVSKTKNKINTK